MRPDGQQRARMAPSTGGTEKETGWRERAAPSHVSHVSQRVLHVAFVYVPRVNESICPIVYALAEVVKMSHVSTECRSKLRVQVIEREKILILIIML
jgi:hypothetical protein